MNKMSPTPWLLILIVIAVLAFALGYTLLR